MACGRPNALDDVAMTASEVSDCQLRNTKREGDPGGVALGPGVHARCSVLPHHPGNGEAGGVGAKAPALLSWLQTTSCQPGGSGDQCQQTQGWVGLGKGGLWSLRGPQFPAGPMLGLWISNVGWEVLFRGYLRPPTGCEKKILNMRFQAWNTAQW